MKRLASINNPEINATLTAPACRCLLLLLEASPGIVLQQEFFKKVWEEEGMLVPTNTLYQNISIVRRGLRAAGESNNRLIVTIPRKGFQIDDSVKIRKLDIVSTPASTETDTVNTEHHRGEENELSLSARDNQAGDPPASLPDVHEHIPQTGAPRLNILAHEAGRFAGWRLSAVAILAAFATGLLAIAYSLYPAHTALFFADYNFVENDNGCRIYTKDDSHDNKDYYHQFKALIKNTGLNCKIYPWVYFPVSPTSPTLTALVCKNEFKNVAPPGCISLYFRKAQSEQ